MYGSKRRNQLAIVGSPVLAWRRSTKAAIWRARFSSSAIAKFCARETYSARESSYPCPVTANLVDDGDEHVAEDAAKAKRVSLGDRAGSAEEAAHKYENNIQTLRKRPARTICTGPFSFAIIVFVMSVQFSLERI